ncbi:uncharacterized protein LOC128675789 [Plodia interpunctella]|uniref:uncharacterized protein LOC128675789 n=1 Tax=Plodia interpunctella TaxID=58824 RepID=UPI002367D86F|nr:uncharacterized protein LOC128675789 [Plodia interpunctella]
MMITYSHTFFTIAIFLSITLDVESIYENETLSEKVNQRNSKVMYSNPKYIKDFSTLTYRVSRRSRYLTTFNMTILTAWDNNYMIEVEVYNHDLKLELMRISTKPCDVTSMRWLSDWLKQHSDVPIVCPIPAGSYHVVRAELPPKNIPLPRVVPSGLYTCHLNGYHLLNTTHRDVLFKMLLELSFNGS